MVTVSSYHVLFRSCIIQVMRKAKEVIQMAFGTVGTVGTVGAGGAGGGLGLGAGIAIVVVIILLLIAMGIVF